MVSKGLQESWHNNAWAAHSVTSVPTAVKVYICVLPKAAPDNSSCGKAMSDRPAVAGNLVLSETGPSLQQH